MLAAQTVHPKVDRLLALLAGACTLHCLIVPLAFALMPSLTLALYSYSDPQHGLAIGVLKLALFEWLAALIASSVALVSTAIGTARHHRLLPLLLAASGAALLSCVTLVPMVRDAALVHSAFAVAGGALLVAAHLQNRAAFKHRRWNPATWRS